MEEDRETETERQTQRGGDVKNIDRERHAKRAVVSERGVKRKKERQR